MITLPFIRWKTLLAAVSYHLLGCPRYKEGCCPHFESGWRWRLYEPLWLLAAGDAFAAEQASWQYSRRQHSRAWRWYYRLFTPAALQEWRETLEVLKALEVKQ